MGKINEESLPQEYKPVSIMNSIASSLQNAY